MTTSTKTPTKTKQSEPANAAIIMTGDEPYRPTTDTAFDIETGPLGGDNDGSLLDAQTSRVAAIGYYEPARSRYLIAYDTDEAAMLRQFWSVFSSLHGAGAKFLGFNVHGFDLPFLIRRSWHHGVPVPRTLMSGGKYWSDTIVDLMAVWKCGGFKEFISLDKLAKFLGAGQKNGDGEMFHLVWHKDRQAAIDYLKNDVKLCVDCACKMGFATSQPA